MAPAREEGAMNDTRIAVIGAGISGLTAAHLLNRHASVRLFEAEPRLGGHTRTVAVDRPGGSVAVDTGFIVYNETTYPLFTALLGELGVATQPSDMSFSCSCAGCGLEFSSRGVRGVFASGSNLVRRGHWSMIRDVFRFYDDARRTIGDGTARALTLKEYLDDRGFGEGFRNHFLIPVTAAVWSTDMRSVLAFPADYLLRFLDNHGLIGYPSSVRWRTVTGGSAAYVERIAAGLATGTVRAGSPVVDVQRGPLGIVVATSDGAHERFDAVVIATHADDALRLLRDADHREATALAGFEYSANAVVLHTDERFLPRRQRARASWNVQADDCRRPADRLTMTYHLNRLQRLPGPEQYLVSVNPATPIRPERQISATTMRHPMYTFRTLRAQDALRDIQGHRGTFYAGAHLGYGFHEDGCRSGSLAAANVLASLAAAAEVAA
jgi:predicted NAD/FAD-binding protein